MGGNPKALHIEIDQVVFILPGAIRLEGKIVEMFKCISKTRLL